MYLENTYINTVNIVKVNITWFIKKNGTNWGIFLIIIIDTISNISVILYIQIPTNILQNSSNIKIFYKML